MPRKGSRLKFDVYIGPCTNFPLCCPLVLVLCSLVKCSEQALQPLFQWLLSPKKKGGDQSWHRGRAGSTSRVLFCLNRKLHLHIDARFVHQSPISSRVDWPRIKKGVACLFIWCTCKFLTYTANMLFSLLLCYFEGRLRSAGSSSPPPSFARSLFLSLSGPLSHTPH